MDGRADLYAVAVMLYEVFTGERPFFGDNPMALLTQKSDPGHDPLALPDACRMPEPLRDFLRRGMAQDPDERFRTAGEMLAALQEALTGKAVTAVGPAGGWSGSSSSRPATPSSSAPAAGPEPTRRIEDGADASPDGFEPTRRLEGEAVEHQAASGSTLRVEDESSAGFGRKRPGKWRWLAIAGGLVVAAGVAAGIWDATSGESGPVQDPILAPMPAPASQPAVEPPAAVSPAPAAPRVIMEPRVEPVATPVPATVSPQKASPPPPAAPAPKTVEKPKHPAVPAKKLPPKPAWPKDEYPEP